MTATVSVLVPWSPGCGWREQAWAWVREKYSIEFPGWELVTGDGATPAGYSRSRAILDAASRAAGEVLVVADADVWCDPTTAVNQVDEHGWSIPHELIHRLSPDSTRQVLAGAPWRGLPLSTDNPQDSRPYRGHPTGTLVVLRSEVLAEVPPDRRFVGWGHEDDAWALALRTLIGPPWRGRDDLVHLWHPPQPRLTRRIGSNESAALMARYRRARLRPAQMRALLEEVR